MRRKTAQLTSSALTVTQQRYDLLIIGGGIYGASLAWEAVLRGLSVALVEKGDFGGATSANSLKIIHGGLRYLQHADWRRMRQATHERSTLMRIAPDLVQPLPVLLPTYGHGLRGREIFRLALKINDLVSYDRNWMLAEDKWIPNGRVLSRQEALSLVPHLPSEGLTGAALFYDAQVYNSERLVLAFLQSASKAGAHLANYTKMTSFLQAHNRSNGKQVIGARVEDMRSGDTFEIRARMVINTCTPWLIPQLRQLGSTISLPRVAKAFNLISKRPLCPHYALGIESFQPYHDNDALLRRGKRLLFIVPWRNYSLIGTEYLPYHGSPDELTLSEDELKSFLTQLNHSYPAAQLTPEDISFAHVGLVPISGIDAHSGSLQLLKQPHLIDHRQEGISGLFSVSGVKYTTARLVAEQVIDQIFAIWQQKAPPSRSSHTPLVREPTESHFSCYLDPTIPNQTLATLQAKICYAIDEEMAHTLADIIFRRTELGSAHQPDEMTLDFCAQVMGKALGWDAKRVEEEKQGIRAFFKTRSVQEAPPQSPPILGGRQLVKFRAFDRV